MHPSKYDTTKNKTYNIIIDTSLCRNEYNFPTIRNYKGENITNIIESYSRGIESIISKENIIPKYLNIKSNLLIEDTDITYAIPNNSSLFGLTGL